MATLLIYSPVGKNPFVNYDDPEYVVHNSHVQDGLSWQTLTWAITATEASNWHPLTWLSHALDCQLFGLNPGGHHWTSIVIHSLNAALLFLILWRATGAIGRSLLVAALFAFHPLNVESVAWIAERKNVLSTLFFFLTLAAYGWYARKPGARRYVAVAALFVLGLASKPMVITLPFVLSLVDAWPLGRVQGWSKPSQAFPVPQRRLPSLMVEKVPLFALAAASAAITVIAQGNSVIPAYVLPFGVRLESAFYAYGMYLLKTIWPVHLALIYPHPGRTLPAWQPVIAGAVMLVMTLLSWKQFFRRPYIAVGWLWFLGTAVPVIGLVQVGLQVIADRYAYLPLIGIFIIVAWGAGDLADHLAIPMLPRTAAATFAIGVLCFFTWRQIAYWQTNIDIWTHALAVTSNNSIAERALGNALLESGRYREGIAHLRNYVRLEPLDSMTHALVGADYQDQGQLSEAIREFEASIRANEIQKKYGDSGLPPEVLATTYANLGVAYDQLGDTAKARNNIHQALAIDAQAVGEMTTRLAQSLREKPSAQGYVRLATLLRETGRLPEADQALAEAQRLAPHLTKTNNFHSPESR